MNDNKLEAARDFLKDNVRQRTDFSQTEQNRGIPVPPVEKPFAADAVRIDLPKGGDPGKTGSMSVGEAIARRESRRYYCDEPLTLDELSFLLWATQGIRLRLDQGHALRTVPSAGCRHAFETYLCMLNVTGTAQGVYRYLPLEHQLLPVSEHEDLGRLVGRAALGQMWVGDAAAVFVWSALPCRMEWRYGMAAHKVIALDAGHVCQNLYLACEAIGAGTCAIAAYDQLAMDTLLGIDGVDEFTIYLAPVGKAG